MDKTALSPALGGRTQSDFAEARAAPGWAVAGQAVRIQSGQLRGLSGNVVKTTDDGLCEVELADLGPGVLVSIHVRQLCRD
jgi:transcription elongation factor